MSVEKATPELKAATESGGVIIKLLREASLFEMGLVAFILLPPILLAWVSVLSAMVPEQYRKAKFPILISLVMIYAALVGTMIYGKTEAEKKRRQEEAQSRELIQGTLRDPNPIWRNLFWIALESGLEEDEIKKQLRAMIQKGEIAKGWNPDHPEWGPIYKLRSR